jgi:hypothetical protein
MITLTSLLAPFFIKHGTIITSDVFINKDSEQLRKMRMVINSAVSIFSEKFGDKYGQIDDNFLSRQDNFEILLDQLRVDKDFITKEKILNDNAATLRDAPSEAVEKFIELLYEEISRDPELNLLFTIKEGTQETIKTIKESEKNIIDALKQLIEKKSELESLTNYEGKALGRTNTTFINTDDIILKMEEEVLKKIDALIEKNDLIPALKVVDDFTSTRDFDKMNDEFKTNILSAKGRIHIKFANKDDAHLILEGLEKINFSNHRRWNFLFNYSLLTSDEVLAQKSIDELIKLGLTNSEATIKLSTFELSRGNLDKVIEMLEEK